MVGRKERVTWHRLLQHVILFVSHFMYIFVCFYLKNLFTFLFHFMPYLCLFNTETITSKVILFSNMIKIDMLQGAL